MRLSIEIFRPAAMLALLCAPVVPAFAASTCPAMRWTTLGTAGGPVPTPERSEPANLLTIGERRILVDTGDGTVSQMARVGETLGAVDAVFISHAHWDHAGGLGAVIGLRWMNQFPGRLTVYGPAGTRAIVDGIVASLATPGRIGFGLGTPPPAPAAAVAVVELADGAVADLGQGITVRAAANSHFDHDGHPDPDNLSLSYRFDHAGRSVTYTGDTGPSAAVDALASGTDLLVSEVIDLDRLLAEIRLRRPDASPQMLEGMQRHLSAHHLAPDAVGAMAARARAKRVVLTHFALPPGPVEASEPGIRAAMARHFPRHSPRHSPRPSPRPSQVEIALAHDLQSFDVGCADAGR